MDRNQQQRFEKYMEDCYYGKDVPQFLEVSKFPKGEYIGSIVVIKNFELYTEGFMHKFKDENIECYMCEDGILKFADNFNVFTSPTEELWHYWYGATQCFICTDPTEMENEIVYEIMYELKRRSSFDPFGYLDEKKIEFINGWGSRHNLNTDLEAQVHIASFYFDFINKPEYNECEYKDFEYAIYHEGNQIVVSYFLPDYVEYYKNLCFPKETQSLYILAMAEVLKLNSNILRRHNQIEYYFDKIRDFSYYGVNPMEQFRYFYERFREKVGYPNLYISDAIKEFELSLQKPYRHKCSICFYGYLEDIGNVITGGIATHALFLNHLDFSDRELDVMRTNFMGILNYIRRRTFDKDEKCMELFNKYKIILYHHNSWTFHKRFMPGKPAYIFDKIFPNSTSPCCHTKKNFRPHVFDHIPPYHPSQDPEIIAQSEHKPDEITSHQGPSFFQKQIDNHIDVFIDKIAKDGVKINLHEDVLHEIARHVIESREFITSQFQKSSAVLMDRVENISTPITEQLKQLFGNIVDITLLMKIVSAFIIIILMVYLPSFRKALFILLLLILVAHLGITVIQALMENPCYREAFQDEEPTHQDESLLEISLKPIISLILMSISVFAIRHIPNEKEINQFILNLDRVPKAITGIEKLFGIVNTIIKKSEAFVQKKILKNEDFIGELDEDVEVLNVYTEIRELVDLSNSHNLIITNAVGDKINALYQKVILLTARAQNEKWGVGATNKLAQAGILCRKLQEAAMNAGAYSNREVRDEPVIEFLCGGSGLGKSTCTELLIQEFGYRRGWSSSETKEKTYSRNPLSDFWDGYRGQEITLFDDFMQLADESGTNRSEPYDIIMLKSHCALNLNMATLQEKPNSFFTSKYILLSSNIKNIRGNIKTIVYPEALIRRFDLTFELDVLPDYKIKKEGVKDDQINVQKAVQDIKDGISKDLKFNLDIWRFFAVNPDSQTRTDTIPQNPSYPYNPKTGFTYAEYCDYREWVYQNMQVQNRKFKYTATNYIELRKRYDNDKIVEHQAFNEKNIDGFSISQLRKHKVSDFFNAVEDEYCKIYIKACTDMEPDLMDQTLEQAYDYLKTEKVALTSFLRHKELNKEPLFTKYDLAYIHAAIAYSKTRVEQVKSLISKYPILSIIAGILTITGTAILGFFALKNVFKGVKEEMTQIPQPAYAPEPAFEKRDYEEPKHVPSNYAVLLKKNVHRVTKCMGRTIPVYPGHLQCSSCHRDVGYVFIDEHPRCYRCGVIREDLVEHYGLEPYMGYGSTMDILGDWVAGGETDEAFPHLIEHQDSSSHGMNRTRKNVKHQDSTSHGMNRMRKNVKHQDSTSHGMNRMRKNVKHQDNSLALVPASPSVENLLSNDRITGHQCSNYIYNIGVKVAVNTFKVYVTTKDSKNLGMSSVVFLEGRTAIVNSHMVKKLIKMKNQIENITCVGSNEVFSCKYDDLEIVMTDDEYQKIYTDLALIRFPKFINMKSTIRNLIALERDVKKLPIDTITSDYSGIMVKLCEIPHKPHPIIGPFMITVNSMRRQEEAVWIDYAAHGTKNIVTYAAQTKDGDCGSCILIDELTVQRPICAIHSGTLRTGRVFGATITKEIIDDLMSKFKPEIVKHQDMFSGMKIDFIDTTIPMPRGDFVRIGKLLENSVNIPAKNSIVRSELFNKLKKQDGTKYISQYAPAVLSDWEDDEGILHCVLKDALSKNGFYFPPLEQKVVDTARYMYFQLIKKNMKCEPRLIAEKDTLILTFEEAVKGVPGCEFTNSLKRKSSAGYSWSLLKTVQHGKKDIFGFEGEFDLTTPLAVEVRRVVNEKLALIKQGIRPRFVWTDCKKMEKRPLDKIVQHKTRSFSCGEVDYIILSRMYFEVFFNALRKNHGNYGSMVGTNVFSNDWNSIVCEGMGTTRTAILAGDFSNFDGTANKEVLESIVDLINDWYDYQQGYEDTESNFVRKVLWTEITQSLHIYKDTVYEWKRSQPSGQPYTAESNCVLLMLCFIIVIRDLIPPSKYRNFFFDFKIYVYGDDSLLFYNYEEYPEINYESIAEGFKKIGMDYTDASKNSNFTRKYHTLDDVTFLKRSFVFNKEYSRYIAPLSQTSIYEMLYWIRDSSHNLDQLKLNCVNALMESSLHGKEFYDHIASQLEDFERKQPHDRFQLIIPTFDDQLSAALGEGLPYLNFIDEL